MYFLYINQLKPNTDPDEAGKVITDHLRWIADKIAAGIVVQAGKWGEDKGVVMFRAEDEKQAESILAEDPIKTSGLFNISFARFWADVEYDLDVKPQSENT